MPVCIKMISKLANLNLLWYHRQLESFILKTRHCEHAHKASNEESQEEDGKDLLSIVKITTGDPGHLVEFDCEASGFERNHAKTGCNFQDSSVAFLFWGSLRQHN